MITSYRKQYKEKGSPSVINYSKIIKNYPIFGKSDKEDRTTIYRVINNLEGFFTLSDTKI